METKHFIQYETCPICNSENHRIVVSAEQLDSERRFTTQFFQEVFLPDVPDYMFKDHIYFTHTYKAELIRCSHCGHITRNPRLSPQDTFLEYSNDNYHKEWLEASYEPYCTLFFQDMPRLKKMLGEELCVLEVGSQVGGFLYAASRFGWKATGVDIGKDMCAFAKSKGHHVIEGTLESASFPEETFDAVFVWNCFEMLPDPLSSLKEIMRILKPGGSLFITIPNGNFISAIQLVLRTKFCDKLTKTILKIMSYDILSGFPFQFGYTSSSITNLLQKADYENIKVNNLNYIPVSSEKQLQLHAIVEKEKILNNLYNLTQFVHKTSFHNLIMAPWIEVICQKPR